MIKILKQQNELQPWLWVQKYHDCFHGYAASRLNDSQTAEDVVQETFLAGIKSADSFRGDSLESTWLSSILRNKTVDVIRKRGRQRSAKLASDEGAVNSFSEDQCRHVIGASFAASPSKAMADTEFMNLVRDAVSQLPKNQADVFRLHELERLEPEEVCDRLDISRGNLWVRLRRARVGLANHVSDKLDHVDSGRHLQSAML